MAGDVRGGDLRSGSAVCLRRREEPARRAPYQDDEALALAGAPHLRFDRQDNGIETGPLAPFPWARGYKQPHWSFRHERWHCGCQIYSPLATPDVPPLSASIEFVVSCSVCKNDLRGLRRALGILDIAKNLELAVSRTTGMFEDTNVTRLSRAIVAVDDS
jgi:hypothetical protein